VDSRCRANAAGTRFYNGKLFVPVSSSEEFSVARRIIPAARRAESGGARREYWKDRLEDVGGAG
jgi:hypothetical protein